MDVKPYLTTEHELKHQQLDGQFILIQYTAVIRCKANIIVESSH